MIDYLDDVMNLSLFKGFTIEEVGKFLFDCDYSIKKYNAFDEIFPKDNNILFL